ncbi:MAG: hypothetical protein AseanaTS_00930 [Candidatus Pelagadaptatus aseana]
MVIAIGILGAVCVDVAIELSSESTKQAYLIEHEADLLAKRLDDRVHLDVKRVRQKSELVLADLPLLESTADIQAQLLPWMTRKNSQSQLALGVEIVFIGTATNYIHAHETDSDERWAYQLDRYLSWVEADYEQDFHWEALFTDQSNHLGIYALMKQQSEAGELFHVIVRVDTPVNIQQYQVPGQKIVFIESNNIAISIQDQLLQPMLLEYQGLTLNSDMAEIKKHLNYNPAETLSLHSEADGQFEYLYFEGNHIPYLMFEYRLRTGMRMLLFSDASMIEYQFEVEVEEGLSSILMTLVSLAVLSLLLHYHFKVQSLIHIDPLTGLLNRGHFVANIEGMLELHNRGRVSDIGVIAIDIDKFKSINDTYGHGVGDEVLKALATMMKNETRKSELVYRFGGEEFIILCGGESQDSLVKLAERLRHVVETQDVCKDILPNGFTISLGVAMREVDEPIERTLTRADDLLYKAKEGGRNQVQFEPV